MLLVQGTRDGKPAALSKEILVNALYNYLWKFVRAPEMGLQNRCKSATSLVKSECLQNVFISVSKGIAISIWPYMLPLLYPLSIAWNIHQEIGMLLESTS